MADLFQRRRLTAVLDNIENAEQLATNLFNAMGGWNKTIQWLVDDINALCLGDLADVDIAGVADQQGIIWDDANSEWVAQTLDLDFAFDQGKVIDGASSAANAMQVGDGTVAWKLYTDGTDVYADSSSGDMYFNPAGNNIFFDVGATATWGNIKFTTYSIGGSDRPCITSDNSGMIVIDGYLQVVNQHLTVYSAGEDKWVQLGHDDTDGFIHTNSGDLRFSAIGYDYFFNVGAAAAHGDLQIKRYSYGGVNRPCITSDGATPNVLVDGYFMAMNGYTIAALSSGDDKYTMMSHDDTDGKITVSSGDLVFDAAGNAYRWDVGAHANYGEPELDSYSVAGFAFPAFTTTGIWNSIGFNSSIMAVNGNHFRGYSAGDDKYFDIEHDDTNTVLSTSSGAVKIDPDSGILWIDSRLGVNTETVPHGGVGGGRLAIEGANSSAASGPHIQTTTASDNYPLFQFLSLTHDSMGIVFDAYFDGAWKSSDAGSNFTIYKTTDALNIYCDDGVAQGGAIAWNSVLGISKVGVVTFGQAPVVLPSAAAAPAVVNGGIYYNTTTGKIQVCEGGAWANVT